MSTNGAPTEITCLIADDHEVVREGLRLSLSRAPRIRVVGEASDGASAVAIAERRRPNVVIMDVRMPGMDGLEATKILSERLPQTAVLIFTAYGERSLLGRGLSNADVASRLFISQETVKSHVRHILAKLEADTRTHAVAIALRESIID